MQDGSVIFIDPIEVINSTSQGISELNIGVIWQEVGLYDVY